MAEEATTLKTTFEEAERLREGLEGGIAPQSVQLILTAALLQYEKSLEIAVQIPLFSHNEELEDVSSEDLKYFLIDFYIAQLAFRLAGGDRQATILRARRHHEKFLSRLEAYRVLDKQSEDTFERYQENPAKFTTILTSDAARRRDVKIANFKAEKALKEKLQHLRSNPRILQDDESVARDLHLTKITLSVHQSFQALEDIAREFDILAMAPSPPASESGVQSPDDVRDRTRNTSEYSERLDPPLSQLGRNGPILSPEGKPLRPFTLLDTRQRLQQRVFRPDHSLPTMTIDEYLEEERKRGGMIDGGGPQSQQRPLVDEDDMDKADEATMKAREWDEFVEANPKGSGNTMNMG